MKIIEGTPEEIKEYLEKGKIKTSTSFATVAKAVSNAKAVSKRDAFNLGSLSVRRKINANLLDALNHFHWSKSKREYIPIDSMVNEYIVNVLRQRLQSMSADEVLADTEVRALVMVLGSRLLEEW